VDEQTIALHGTIIFPEKNVRVQFGLSTFVQLFVGPGPQGVYVMGVSVEAKKGVWLAPLQTPPWNTHPTTAHPRTGD
jgi:hypothetical protein